MACGKEMSSTFIISQSFFVKTECEIQDGAKTALKMQKKRNFSLAILFRYFLICNRLLTKRFQRCASGCLPFYECNPIGV